MGIDWNTPRIWEALETPTIETLTEEMVEK